MSCRTLVKAGRHGMLERSCAGHEDRRQQKMLPKFAKGFIDYRVLEVGFDVYTGVFQTACQNRAH